MFIYNFKINGSKIFKVIFTGIIILMILVLVFVLYKVFNGSNYKFKVSDSIDGSKICKISAQNYTNILKTVHEDIDTYVGKQINFTGYVYRLIDFSDSQFVLARDMIINSNYQTVVVGFLCECDDAKDFKDGSWIEITGEIIKGFYHGDMPIIKITNIKSTSTPSEEYVYPPDDSYIPTSALL